MEPDETMEEQLHDQEVERTVQIRAALNMFHAICRQKNKPDAPCAGCPLWSICGTLPGSLDDDTIEATAWAAAEYLREQEEEADENAL